MSDHNVIYRRDYQAPVFSIKTTELEFDLHDQVTTVSSRLKIERQHDGSNQLRLHGEDLVLKSLRIDGKTLAHNEYALDENSLTLFELPDAFELEVVTEICPEKNTALEGLYKSGTMYCTQCEAEGFRNITYYLDQPDVLSVFTTQIEADASRYPVLLSNGNKINDERLDNGRRRVTWHDPFPKPSYLFALVAGDLAQISDTFETRSGRSVALEIYSEPHNIGQCDYAMGALKRSMRWDEEVFGREYDLDVFMIVAVEDFNMGAMENKGLNIFNTSCVLATPDTATDAGFERVEAVVAHEYFHNWSGNRVTCRDWFQLSLKEGFTVFRDAEFSADMNAATVKRIDDVAHLRAVQFAEDAGPMAHSIRPDSYIEINNFYTTTVYEKGAEVVRMLHTLLGAEGFRKGSDLYFDRHDGQAVTTEDFVQAMEAANDTDLSAFRAWYAQAGTPRISVAQVRKAGELEVTIAQSCPPTPGQERKVPFHVPFTIGVVDEHGNEIAPDVLDARSEALTSTRDDGLLVELVDESTTVTLQNVPENSVLSVLRGFSAPVIVHTDRSSDELAHLVLHDSDGFSRWDACQTLMAQEISELAKDSERAPDSTLVALSGQLLEQAVAAAGDQASSDAQALLAKLLTLPAEADLLERERPVDVQALLGARERLSQHIATTHSRLWRDVYEALSAPIGYTPDAASMARRALRNRALASVCEAASGADQEALLQQHYEQADNLTDRRAAMEAVLASSAVSDEFRSALLDGFYETWKAESLVVNVWLSLQAVSPLDGALARVIELESHESFDSNNPNRVRALYAGFAMANHRQFHAEDGSGYQFLAERVMRLNDTNPQVASRLTGPLTQWRRYTPAIQTRMRTALSQLLEAPALSANVFELVSKSLSD